MKKLLNLKFHILFNFKFPKLWSKFAVIGFFLAFAVSNAEETRSSENQSQLTSSQNNKQQNKRLASYGSSSASSLSSYKPITGSYSSANPPLFTPSVSNTFKGGFKISERE
ncbi:CLUMA_CG013086, isoform A [Clunio marinus]|uniref:CLUMA_CG013086, isoform A n=1 Tax=Clunio marinus TaxID=568069 RepID=A0A1J1IKR8_9DIPT|nr:CLUMA_CG013086, isoform A [Clunio marinus]